jgi:hypothetical protein
MYRSGSDRQKHVEFAPKGLVMTSMASWVSRGWRFSAGDSHWHFCQFSKLSCRSTLHFVAVTISTCVDPTECLVLTVIISASGSPAPFVRLRPDAFTSLARDPELR